MSNFLFLLFKPKRFFNERFTNLSSKTIFKFSFIGVFFGVLLGSLFTAYFTNAIMGDFLQNKSAYLPHATSLGLTEQSFLELLKAQRAYCVLMVILSPLIAYVAPHLFGGALYIFLWLLVRHENVKFEFTRVMECAAIALTSVAFYAIPAIGPFIAVLFVGINVSRALFVQYQITGFMKTMSILSALYVCFFLSSATLQLLALPVASFLK